MKPEQAAAETSQVPAMAAGADASFSSVRALLLAEEWNRIDLLEQQTSEQVRQAASLQAEIAALRHELQQQTQLNANQQAQIAALHTTLADLRQEMKQESEAVIPRLTQALSGMITSTIERSRYEIAEALGPVMGDAIRVQIRDSRKSMVEVLYPIIIETVQRAIAEFARELQRNIDARLKRTFSAQGYGRTLIARLRGISPAELMLRDSFPFQVEEMFLIQHESGLLMTHLGEDGSDSDMISGMLTAIRDFTQDSFGDGDPDHTLDEIQYGDERIIIQNGESAYLAVVIKGVEPEGFRYQLRQFVSELHIQYSPELRAYDGDSQQIAVLSPKLPELAAALTDTAVAQPAPMNKGQRRLLWGAGLVSLLLLALACFYLQFTLALLPVAFGEDATAIPTPLSTPAPAATPQPTWTPVSAADTDIAWGPLAITAPAPPVPATVQPVNRTSSDHSQ